MSDPVPEIIGHDVVLRTKVVRHVVPHRPLGRAGYASFAGAPRRSIAARAIFRSRIRSNRVHPDNLYRARRPELRVLIRQLGEQFRIKAPNTLCFWKSNETLPNTAPRLRQQGLTYAGFHLSQGPDLRAYVSKLIGQSDLGFQCSHQVII